MRLFRFLGIILVVYAASLAHGQLKGKPVTAKLVETKPGVYIDEVYPGLVPSGSEVWLRLHNNYRWRIAVCQYEEFDLKEGILGLNYEMERIDVSGMAVPTLPGEPTSQGRSNRAFPRGNPADGDCKPYELLPGKMISFRVDRDNLIRWARVKVPFFMQWEDVQEARRGEEPRHAAYFYSRKLVVE